MRDELRWRKNSPRLQVRRNNNRVIDFFGSLRCPRIRRRIGSEPFRIRFVPTVLLVGWKTAVLTAFIGVGAVHIYWAHGSSNSPLKVEKEGSSSSPSARQKTFSKKLGTSFLLILSLFPLWLFMTFFIIWTP